MRTAILSFLIVSFSFNISGQNYIPVPMQNCYWEMTEFQTCTSNSIPSGQSTLIYRIYPDNDTLIGTTNYTKFYSQTISSNMGSGCYLSVNTGGDGYLGAMRQDTVGKKIFMIYPNQTNENLLYDFNLGVGDSVKTILGTANGQPDPYRIIIDVVFQSYSDGTCRKKFKLKPFSVSAPSGTTYNAMGYYDSFIEGIGNGGGILNTLGGLGQGQPPYWSLSEDWSCVFAMNNVTVYATTPNTCTQSVEAVKYNVKRLTVFPNPAQDAIRICINGTPVQNGIIKIFDVVGKEVVTTNDPDIYVNQLSAGYYFIRFLNADTKEVYTASFMRE